MPRYVGRAIGGEPWPAAQRWTDRCQSWDHRNCGAVQLLHSSGVWLSLFEGQVMTDPRRRCAALQWYPEPDHRAQPAADLRLLRDRQGDARSRDGTREYGVAQREQNAATGIVTHDLDLLQGQRLCREVRHVQLVGEKRPAVGDA